MDYGYLLAARGANGTGQLASHAHWQAKCKLLHLGWCKTKHEYRLGDEWTVSSPVEKDSGLLVDEKLNVTQQCVLAA